MVGSKGEHRFCLATRGCGAKPSRADTSLRWCGPDSRLSLWFLLLFWGIFFNLLQLSNPVSPSGVPRIALCQSRFWVQLSARTLGS